MSGEIVEKDLECGHATVIVMGMESNTTTKLKKGHLYFHVANARVERIVNVLNETTVQHRHHNETTVSTVSDFRLATREEVMSYLGR